MASTVTTNSPEGTILGTLLQPGLPVDTDGLPGLADAPVVYDLILRDLREADVLAEGPAPARGAPPAAGKQGQSEAPDARRVLPRDDSRRG